MKLFNLMNDDLAFLKQGLMSNAPTTREFDAHGADCQVCHSVCATGCGANCRGGNSSN